MMFSKDGFLILFQKEKVNSYNKSQVINEEFIGDSKSKWPQEEFYYFGQLVSCINMFKSRIQLFWIKFSMIINSLQGFAIIDLYVNFYQTNDIEKFTDSFDVVIFDDGTFTMPCFILDYLSDNNDKKYYNELSSKNQEIVNDVFK